MVKIEFKKTVPDSSTNLGPRRKGFFSSSLVLTIIFFFVFFAVVASIISYSASAKPASVLYPIKLAVEDVKVRFTQHPRDTAVLYHLYLTERLEETQSVYLNPSLSYDRQSKAVVLSTEDTSSEIVAGLQNGTIDYDYATLTASIEDLSKFPDSLDKVAENTTNEEILREIENLRDRLTTLSNKFEELESYYVRRVDLSYQK